MSGQVPSLHFRRGTVADIPTMLELMPLYYEADHLEYDERRANSTLQHFLTQPGLGRLWLVQESAEGPAIGYAAVAFGFSLEFGGRDAIVDELFVREEHRGKGYGSATLHHVVAECRKEGIIALRLEVTPTNPRALALYQRLGFKDLGRSLLAFSLSSEG